MTEKENASTIYWRNAAMKAQDELKYSVHSTYLLASCEEYGIDWHAMHRLIADYFGFDGKNGIGRE